MTHIKSRKHASPRTAAPAGLATATLLTGLALALPAPARADEAGAEPRDDATTFPAIEVQRERIATYRADTVASPKFTQPLIDTPQTIQVITSDLFNEQGATTLTEALRNSPGVGTFYVGENGNTTTGDTVYMRGFDSSSSIFVDGVRDLGSISRDVFNVEQVEVAKGPAGTDYGRSAPTGAINLVTKQANLRDAASATATVGSDGQRRVTADINRAFAGIPGSAFRLNALWQDSDVAGRDHVSAGRHGIAPSLAFGLGTATRFHLDLLYIEQDNMPDGGVPTIGLPGYESPDPERPWLSTAAPVDPENFYGTPADHDDVSARMATFRVEHDFSDTLRLTNTARWGSNRQDYLLTAFMGGAGNLATPDPADPARWTITRNLPTFRDQDNTILTDQLNLRADFATGRVGHDLSAGLEFTREELDTRGQAVTAGSSWPDANLYDPDWNATGLAWAHNGADTRGRSTSQAVYAFDTLKFGDALLVTAGLRLDHYEAEYDASVICGGRGGPACEPNPPGTLVVMPRIEDSGTLFTWKLGAVRKLGEDASLYANFATSKQPPGGSSLVLSSAANNANNPAMDPQEARTSEIGGKWNLLGDQLLLSAALFRTDVSNEVITDTDGTVHQGGEKRVQGVELSAVGKLTENWALSAGYTQLDATVEEGAPTAEDGTANLTYTPDQAFTAWTTYHFPAGVTVGGGVRYTGDMHRGTDGAVGTPAFTRSWTVYDAVATWRVNPQLDVRLNAYNLFDKRYVAAINKSGYRYTPGTPRTFVLSADFRF